MGVKRFGVAFVATASIVLAYALPARAQEAPPPASSTPAETTSTEAATPAPDATPPTPSSSEPAKPDTPAPDATPSADTAKADTPRREHSGTRREDRRARNDRARQDRAGRGQARGGDARTEGRRQARAADPNLRRAGAACRSPCAASRPGAGTVRCIDSGHDRAGRGDPRRRRSCSVRHGDRRRGRRDSGGDDREFPTPPRSIGDLAAADGRPDRRVREPGPAPSDPREVLGPPDLCAAHGPRAAVGGLRAGSSDLRLPRQAEVPARLGGAGGHRPRPVQDQHSPRRDPAATGIEGGQEASGRRGTTDGPVRQLGSGSRQPQLQPLDRGDLVVARPRARGAALARAAAVPLRPLAPAEHDSARRDHGSSPRSTRVAPDTTPFSATPEDSRAGGSRVDRGQMSFGRT